MDDWQSVPSNNNIIIVIVIVLVAVGIIILIISIVNSGKSNTSNISSQGTGNNQNNNNNQDDDDDDDDAVFDSGSSSSNLGNFPTKPANSKSTLTPISNIPAHKQTPISSSIYVAAPATVAIPIHVDAPVHIPVAVPTPVDSSAPAHSPVAAPATVDASVHIPRDAPSPVAISVDVPAPVAVIPVISNSTPQISVQVVNSGVNELYNTKIDEAARNADLASVEDFDGDNSSYGDPVGTLSSVSSMKSTLSLASDKTPEISSATEINAPSNESLPTISALNSYENKSSDKQSSDLGSEINSDTGINEKINTNQHTLSSLPSDIIGIMNATVSLDDLSDCKTQNQGMPIPIKPRPMIPQPAKISPYVPAITGSKTSGSIMDETSGFSVDASMTNPASLSSDFSSPTEKSVRNNRRKAGSSSLLKGMADLGKYTGKGFNNNPRMGPFQ